MTSVSGVNNYSDRQPTSSLNETSFDKDGQFTGTSWNRTAYIKDDKNSNTVFEHDKEMTIQLNSRYNNGGEAIFKNLDRKHTGISFDLLDKFIEAAKDGILEDVDHKGYTDENKIAFGKAFDELQKKKATENPYNRKYTNMKDKTTFTFSADELKTLYEAAGFSLVKKEEPPKPAKSEPVKVEEPEPAPAEPETPAAPTEPEKPIEPEAPAEDKEKIAVTGKYTTKQIIEDGLVKAGAVSDGETVCVDFKGKLNPDNSGNYVKKGKFTIRVSDNPEIKAHEVPDEYATKAKYKIENGKIYISIKGVHKSGNIFHKREWQEIGPANYTPNQEAAQEVEGAN